MEVKGRVIKILGITTGKGASAWRKQEFVIETEGKYPKNVAMSVWGDKIEQFNIKEGSRIVAEVDLESREYNNRWYTDVKAFKITGSVGANEYADVATPNMGGITDDDNQLPF